MRLIGYLGFGLTDSSFQSSLLGTREVGFDMARWSVGGKVGGGGGRCGERVRIEILTWENFWNVQLNFVSSS